MTAMRYDFPTRTPMPVELVKRCDLCEDVASFTIECEGYGESRWRVCRVHLCEMVSGCVEVFGPVVVRGYQR